MVGYHKFNHKKAIFDSKHLFCLASAPKRFYKNAGILSCDGKYEITLDTKKLKTPKGDPFYVKSEPLALAGNYYTYLK